MFIVGTSAEKPKAALINQQKALLNIETKISVLERWVKDGIPYACDEGGEAIELPGGASQRDYYPSSVRQFNFWERSKQCHAVAEELPEFSRNANDTLRRHPGYQKQVQLLLSQLTRRVVHQNKKERVPALAELRRQLEVADARKGVLEVELVTMRSTLTQLESKVSRMERQMDADLAEAVKLQSKSESEIAELRRENAELTKTLRKIKSIGPIR
jgi:hypothetical protein